MCNKNRGITIVALVITIVILIILTSVATYSGIEVVRSSKYTVFTTELKIMQTKVNEWYEEYKNGKNDVLSLGEEISSNQNVQNQANKVFTENESGINDVSGYRYFSIDTIKGLGIEEVESSFFINMEKRSVVSYEGYKYKGKTYYTIEQIPNGMYNVEYESMSGKPTFDVSYEAIAEDKYVINIDNIKYDGNIKKWIVKYQKKGDTEWKTSENLNFIVTEQGDYNIKIENKTVVSDEKVQHVGYIQDGLVMHFDGINNTGNGHSNNLSIWKDISGNNNDITLYNFDQSSNSGWENDGILFDGVDDYMFRENPLYNKSAKNITVEVLSEGTDTQWGAVQDFSSITNERAFLKLWISPTSDGTNRCYSANFYPGYSYDIPKNKLEYNQLNLIAYGCDGKNIFTYLDGNKQDYRELSEDADTSWLANTFYLGRDHLAAPRGGGEPVEGLNYYFKGKIKAVRVYDRGLTEDEIKNNYMMDNVRYNIK